MAKSKRRTKRSWRTKAARATVGAGCTASTLGIKDVRPPETNNVDEINRDVEETLALLGNR